MSARSRDVSARRMTRTLADAQGRGQLHHEATKAEQAKRHWQTAAEAVLAAAEDRGPMMHAHIGMLQALNQGKPAPDQPQRRKAAKAYKIVR